MGTLGKPSLDDRLDALASRLTAASDISTVLAIPRDVLEMVTSASLRTYRARRELRRARELRRQCELAVGQMLISMKARDLLCEEGFRKKTPEGRARVSLGELGLCWPTANRWETRARALRATVESGEKAGRRRMAS
jgi:hypothetical protein